MGSTRSFVGSPAVVYLFAGMEGKGELD